jgi:hypothetical protein
MRTLSAEGLVAIDAGRFAAVLLVEMQLSLPLYACSAVSSIEWNGVTWVGVDSIASVGPVIDSSGELQPLDFSLLAADPAIVAIALGEPTQGKPVIVRSMLLDPETQAVIDVQTVWSGTLESPSYEEQFNEEGLIVAKASLRGEHRGVSMQRPNPFRYTDADQQRAFPGDRGLEYIVAQAVHQDVWPAAAFFRQ